MTKALALLGLSLAVTVPAQAADIYVMRHLERDEGKDPSLNATGVNNAERLAAWFRRDRPRTIYVTGFRRARETAAPLAARLGVAPTPYDPAKSEAMIAAVKAAKGSVLIVGHSNTVPKIVEALGEPAAGDLDDGDYGRIWIVSRRGKPVRIVKLSEPQP